MRVCELCGETVSEDEGSCSRCGFEFPQEVFSDSRDASILEKHNGKSVDVIKKELSERILYFRNLDAQSLMPAEFSALVEEAVSFLHIPVVIGFGDELRLDEKEKELILAMWERLAETRASVDAHNIRTESYMKLSNALFCLEYKEKAMELLDMAIFRDPNDPDALYNKAKLLFFEKKYDESKRYLAKVTSKCPDREDAKYLAEMLEQLDVR